MVADDVWMLRSTGGSFGSPKTRAHGKLAFSVRKPADQNSPRRTGRYRYTSPPRASTRVIPARCRRWEKMVGPEGAAGGRGGGGGGSATGAPSRGAATRG